MNNKYGSPPPLTGSDIIIGFRFTGGLAKNGEMNFYEAGRYRYAAARLLYTVEHFRQSGKVLERLTTAVNADFRVSAPQSGSFLEQAVLYAAPFITDINKIIDFVNLPFDKILPWVLHKILPRSSNERLIDLAEKQVAAIDQLAKTMQEREKTAQITTQEETSRLRLILGHLKAEGPSSQNENLEYKSEITAVRLIIE